MTIVSSPYSTLNLSSCVGLLAPLSTSLVSVIVDVADTDASTIDFMRAHTFFQSSVSAREGSAEAAAASLFSFWPIPACAGSKLAWRRKRTLDVAGSSTPCSCDLPLLLIYTSRGATVMERSVTNTIDRAVNAGTKGCWYISRLKRQNTSSVLSSRATSSSPPSIPNRMGLCSKMLP